MRRETGFAILIVGTGLLTASMLRPDNRAISLAFAGDVMLGRQVAQANAAGGWGQALTGLSPWTSEVDIVFANLESPLTQATLEKPTFDLRGPPQAATALRSAGFNLVSLANNHVYDAGSRGLEDTEEALKAEGISFVGPDARPWLRCLNGLTLAWLAFDDTTQAVDVDVLRTALNAAASTADLVIVSIHWGSGLETAPNPRQLALAAEMAAAGADVIVGHHPHVLQPVEWIWGPGRGRGTLVAYSLGNALFDQPSPPTARYGALLVVTMGATGVQAASAIPFEIDPHSWRVTLAAPTAVEAVTRSLGLPASFAPPGSFHSSLPRYREPGPALGAHSR